MYEIELTAEAERHLLFWSKNDKKMLKRIRKLLANMQQTPYTGLGKPEALQHKPEALRHEWSGFYSRRIDSQHRIVYTVNEEQRLITIHLMRYHY